MAPIWHLEKRFGIDVLRHVLTVNLNLHCLGVVCKFGRGGGKGQQTDICDAGQNKVLVKMQPPLIKLLMPKVQR